jgi:hypothetical protein
MKRNKFLIDTLTIRISNVLLEKYKKYCDNNGLLLSKRLRFLMEKDIEDKIKIEK